MPALIARSDMISTIMGGVVSASGRAGERSVLAPPLALDSVPFAMAWHRRNDGHSAQRWLRYCIADVSAVVAADLEASSQGTGPGTATRAPPVVDERRPTRGRRAPSSNQRIA